MNRVDGSKVRGGDSLRLLPLVDEPLAATPAEAGIPDVIIEAWYGVLAPAGTPPDIMAELVATLRATLADPAVRKTLASMGCEPIVEAPEQLSAAIRAEDEQAHTVARLIAERP